MMGGSIASTSLTVGTFTLVLSTRIAFVMSDTRVAFDSCCAHCIAVPSRGLGTVALNWTMRPVVGTGVAVPGVGAVDGVGVRLAGVGPEVRSVGAGVGACVGARVGARVGAFVGAFVGGGPGVGMGPDLAVGGVTTFTVVILARSPPVSFRSCKNIVELVNACRSSAA